MNKNLEVCIVSYRGPRKRGTLHRSLNQNIFFFFFLISEFAKNKIFLQIIINYVKNTTLHEGWNLKLVFFLVIQMVNVLFSILKEEHTIFYVSADP